jgi:hypothetical protein
LPTLDGDTSSILAAVVALGGVGAAFSIGTPGAPSLASFAVPVARSLEDEIKTVLESTSAVIAKAVAAQAPNGPTLQTTEGGDLRMGETAHRDIDDVRARLALWRDRLGLAMGDVDAQMKAAETALDTECDRALAAVEARKAARKASRSSGSGSPPPALDARAA